MTCCAIGAAVAVILLLEGFQQGLLIQLREAVLNRGADLIVTQSGVSNFIGSRSLLPQLSRRRIEAVAGVKAAHPMTLVPVIYEQAGEMRPIFFVVYDTAGGPARLSAGREVRKPREIVIDESLAQFYRLAPGDPFVVADYEFRIAGIAQQASAFFTAFAFINYDDMIDFYFDSDLVGDISNLPLLSYLLVELEPGVDRNVIRPLIEAAEPAGDVYTPQQIANNDMALGRTLFGPVLGVMIGAGYVIALLVVGMIMFAVAHGRLRSLGVLKALGFTNGALSREMVLEAVALSLLALPVALLLAQAASGMIETQAPLYLVPVAEPGPLLRTLLGAMLLAIVGALLPLRYIARLDPAIVFRG
jgi:putative ABC transport system permease protein